MSETVLQPGVSIKPKIDQNAAKTILLDVYGFSCSTIQELNGYDDSNYFVKVKDECDNRFVTSVCQHGYVLKVINSLDSKIPDFFEAQAQLLLYLGKKDVRCPKPVKTKSGEYNIVRAFESGSHVIRLLEFIPGRILHDVPLPPPQLFHRCGEYVARLDEALKGFHHPIYDKRKTVWMLEEVPKLHEFLFAIKDEERKNIVREVVDQFSSRVSSAIPHLEKGIIHGDFNEQNVVVEEREGEWSIVAILDFGDSQKGCYLFEVAITMAYMMLEGKSVESGSYVLAGYSSVRRLPAEEVNLLKVCVAARLCQSLVMGAYSSLQDPQNSYVLTTAKAGWMLLEELWAKPEEELLLSWTNVDIKNI